MSVKPSCRACAMQASPSVRRPGVFAGRLARAVVRAANRFIAQILPRRRSPPARRHACLHEPGELAGSWQTTYLRASGQEKSRGVIRTIPTPGSQVATLPPTQSPKDQFDLAYGYVLHKDYALAEKAFRSFIEQYPNERLVPDAQYWLGETLFQRQRYQDAADVFLVVVRNHETSGKAPDALLRLGQSLHAIGQKEMACASLGEVERKFPRASAGVKRSVAAEQKRAHC